MFGKICPPDAIRRRVEPGADSMLRRSGSRSGRTAARLLIIAGFLLAVNATSHAATLEGRVLYRNSQPAFNVNVDVMGPVTIYTQTDKDGNFQVTLPAGAYVIRVRDRGRRMEFSRNITEENHNATFRLAW